MHQSWLKNHMCVLGWISRSHARNGNEIQTSRHRGSAGKIQNMPENHETWHGVMSSYYHAVVKKLQNRNKFWYKFLANRSFSQEGSWFWEGMCHLCVHNSNFKYKHMLQCTKAGWKITCVSSGKFLGPMPEMGMKFKHLGVMARLETLRNLVF